MQKLRYAIINRIKEENLTGTEIDILLYISRFQDESGRIKGIYYKDIAAATCRHKTQIYVSLKKLEEKHFISREKGSRYDMNITILNNDYSNKCYRGTGNGYLATNKKIFLSGEFFRMKAKEKILTLELLKNCDSAANGTYMIKRQVFIAKFQEYFHVHSRSIQGYLKRIKEYFNVFLKNGVYYIKRLKKKIEWSEWETIELGITDRETLYTQEVNTALRRNKVKGSTEEKKELITILTQYNEYAEAFDLAEIIHRSLEMLHNNLRELNIKLIHKLVREKIICS